MNPKEDPWDYSVEGTQQRSLGGFSEEGLNEASMRACENGEHGRGSNNFRTVLQDLQAPL